MLLLINHIVHGYWYAVVYIIAVIIWIKMLVISLIFGNNHTCPWIMKLIVFLMCSREFSGVSESRVKKTFQVTIWLGDCSRLLKSPIQVLFKYVALRRKTNYKWLTTLSDIFYFGHSPLIKGHQQKQKCLTWVHISKQSLVLNTTVFHQPY